MVLGSGLPDIEAEISFLSAEEGGRKNCVYSGYRGQFFYEGHDWDADQQYPEVDEVLPGQLVRATIRFLSPENHLGRVVPGMPFEIREGSRTVGRGVVTKILHLRENAEKRAAD